MSPSSKSTADLQHSENSERFFLWIDGVGGYLLCLADQIRIGGPSDPNVGTEISLLANLSRHHATISRAGDSYLLEPKGPTQIGHRLITETTPLNDNDVLQLGANVTLKFRIPSVLSGTAQLDFISDHRPIQNVDGVICMTENCLLGPNKNNHIVCPEITETVVLFRRQQNFWCRSKLPITIDEKTSLDGGPILPGQIVQTTDIRFRIEPFPTASN